MRAPPKTVLRTLVGAFTLSMTAFGDTGGPLGMKAEAANNGSAFGYGSYSGYLTFDWYRFIATRVLATMIYVK